MPNSNIEALWMLTSITTITTTYRTVSIVWITYECNKPSVMYILICYKHFPWERMDFPEESNNKNGHCSTFASHNNSMYSMYTFSDRCKICRLQVWCYVEIFVDQVVWDWVNMFEVYALWWYCLQASVLDQIWPARHNNPLSFSMLCQCISTTVYANETPTYSAQNKCLTSFAAR